MADKDFPGWHGTTIIGVRKGGKVVVAGAGPQGHARAGTGARSRRFAAGLTATDGPTSSGSTGSEPRATRAPACWSSGGR